MPLLETEKVCNGSTEKIPSLPENTSSPPPFSKTKKIVFCGSVQAN